MEEIKVITALQMAEVEAKSIREGANADGYMKAAGRALAEVVEEYILDHELSKRLVLLIGKGNNGGDAYTLGEILVRAKYAVRAYALFPDSEVSELNRAHKKKFMKQGGEIVSILSAQEIVLHENELVIDGLLGTGFQGKAGGIIADAIAHVNKHPCLVISIDIPSGLNGSTGEVASFAMKADLTIYLGQPKLGFFVGEGYDYIGHLSGVEFGLDKSEMDPIDPKALLIDNHSIKSLLPTVKRTRHKYEAGYVLGFAGTREMPGAAVLSTLACLRGGAGIVRLFTPEGTMIPGLAAEVIHAHWDQEQIKSELKRTKSLFLGPGMGRNEASKEMLFWVLKQATQPCVIDADALMLLKGVDLSIYQQPLILTPHRKECFELTGIDSIGQGEEWIRKMRAYVDQNRVILVLKGAPTWVFRPQMPPSIMTHGSPAMATAGSGDVLTGILAALLAQGMDPMQAALLGIGLHGIAGEMAAIEKTVYSVIASDLIDYLHEAFFQLIK